MPSSLARVMPAHTLATLRGAQFGEEGAPAVAQPALVQRLLELCFAGELYLPSSSGCLDQGGEVLLLARGEAGSVEVPPLLPLEEPYAPGERDEDAARLGARDLTLPPVHLERGPGVHAHSVFLRQTASSQQALAAFCTPSSERRWMRL